MSSSGSGIGADTAKSSIEGGGYEERKRMKNIQVNDRLVLKGSSPSSTR